MHFILYNLTLFKLNKLVYIYSMKVFSQGVITNSKGEERRSGPFCRTYWRVSSNTRKHPTQCFLLIWLVASLFAVPSLILWVMRGTRILWLSQSLKKLCPLSCSNSILKGISIEIGSIVNSCRTTVVFLSFWQPHLHTPWRHLSPCRRRNLVAALMKQVILRTMPCSHICSQDLFLLSPCPIQNVTYFKKPLVISVECQMYCRTAAWNKAAFPGELAKFHLNMSYLNNQSTAPSSIPFGILWQGRYLDNLEPWFPHLKSWNNDAACTPFRKTRSHKVPPNVRSYYNETSTGGFCRSVYC